VDDADGVTAMPALPAEVVSVMFSPKLLLAKTDCRTVASVRTTSAT